MSNGRKPPNPQGVPKQHGRKPSSPTRAPRQHGTKPPAPPVRGGRSTVDGCAVIAFLFVLVALSIPVGVVRLIG